MEHIVARAILANINKLVAGAARVPDRGGPSDCNLAGRFRHLLFVITEVPTRELLDEGRTGGALIQNLDLFYYVCSIEEVANLLGVRV